MASLHKPDVILMDLSMPGMDGITATREIKQEISECKGDRADQLLGSEHGAGCIASRERPDICKKMSLRRNLHTAIRSAHEGKMTLSPEAVQALANSAAQPQIRGNTLTERERDVLRCMVDGMNNNEIAEKLVISLGTVKFHVSNIFQKLGVDSRVEAVKMAMEQRLI